MHRLVSAVFAGRRTLSLAVVGLALVLTGCVSSSGTLTSGYRGPAVSALSAKYDTSRRDFSAARKDVRKARRDLKALERRIARAERQLKRKRISEKRRARFAKQLKDDKRKLRKARRDVKRAERQLARAKRARDRAQRRVETAKRRKAEAARRFAEQEKARRQKEARELLARKKENEEEVRGSRIASLFNSNDPALANVNDYGARIDNAFPIAAVPIDKVNKRFYRQEVRYRSKHKPGTVVVDPHGRFLYLVMSGGRAMRYGIGVGRQGFEWQGTAYIGWKQKWPKWTPPEEMIAREPHLAKWGVDNGGMPGGPTNPLGARALYLFQDGKDTLYRLHGTPQWASIGTAASSGCIRLMNQDVIDLYKRVPNGARVVVL